MKQAMLLTVNSLLLISLKSIFLAVVFIQVVRCSYFSIIPGSVLFDHVLSTHSVESSLICGQHCLRNKLCLSFNLRTIPSRNTMFLCELSASDTKMSPTNLHKHSDYEYFEYKDICPPKGIAVLPYIDDQCNVDTSLIRRNKGSGNVTKITHAFFQHGRYQFNYSEAVHVCGLLHGALASLEQMQAAWNNGFQQCSYGWLFDEVTVVPMQEKIVGCLRTGLNRHAHDKGTRYDAYCIGVND